MSTRFSILVPTFNHKNYIGECLDSILSQATADDEVLVNDDGSTDGSLQIISKFKGKVKLFQTNRKGPSLGLNQLIQKAQGQYMTFISGDDVATLDRLKSHLEFLNQARPNDLGISAALLIDQNSQLLNPEVHTLFRKPKSTDLSLYQELFFAENFLCAGAFVARREQIQKIGNFLPLSLQLQDFEYWVRALKKGFNFQWVSQPWIKYRWTDSQNSLSSFKNKTRIQFEKETLYRSFFDDVDLQFLKKNFSNFNADRLTLKGFKALLYLKHKDPGIQRLGLQEAFLMDNESECQEFLRQLNWTELDYFSKSNSLDYFNPSFEELKKIFFQKLGKRLSKN